jgi:hypothetical protein
MKQDWIEKLGSPDLKLEGLQIWIHSRQFPDSEDYWDGNWLNVTVHCGASGASVFTNGSIIHLPELERWLSQIESLLTSSGGEANLECIEPNLSVGLKANSLGHIAMEVSITPDHMTQRHRFEYQIDQSYLPALVRQLKAILETHPTKSVPA